MAAGTAGSGGTVSTAGATVIANMVDDGTGNGTYKIGSFTVTSPGLYTVAPTTVTLTGGGAGTAASGFTINTSANTSGGMTFAGAGTTLVAAKVEGRKAIGVELDEKHCESAARALDQGVLWAGK